MHAVLIVTGLWLLFAGSHVGLGVSGLRDRLGPRRFTLLFVAVASVMFSLLVSGYATLRFNGPMGPALGQDPTLRTGLIVAISLGLGFTACAAGIYPKSPYAQLRGDGSAPTGMGRITRHPFMIGFALLCGAHALLATRLVTTVFFGGFVILALAGSCLQDRRLARQKGESYTRFLEQTSFVPFAAIIAGRQRLVWSELARMSVAFIIGLAAAFALHLVHDKIFVAYGTPFAMFVLVPAWFYTWQGLQRDARAHP